MRGFTLAEIILSIFVVLVAMGALIAIFPSSAGAVKHAENRVVADALGQSALEVARAQAFSALTLYTTDLGNVTEGGTTFSRSQEVFAVPGTDVNYLKGVRVVLNWTETSGDQKWTQETWICNVEK